MKRVMAVLLVASTISVVGSVAQAALVERTYAFTGADLINNVFGSYRHSDGSLKAYEGMRSIYPGLEFSYEGGATYLGATGAWATRFNTIWDQAVTDGRVLDTFWLSGNNGNSGQWGEDYKPFEWVGGTGPDGWVFSAATKTWTTDTAGLALDSTELASQVFTVTMKFDTEDMWWGNPNNYVYGCNTAPNGLNEGLTMYFGAQLSKDGTPVNGYVGNMFAAIPEPATLVMLALGGLLCRKFRKA